MSRDRRAGYQFGSSSACMEKDPVEPISLFQPYWSPMRYVGKVSPEQRVQESHKES